MTENIPPVPPAPQPQNYPPESPGAGQGYQTPYPPTQPYQPAPAYSQGQHAYAQAPYQQVPQQYARAGYPLQVVPKSSGLRIAAGILGVLLGTWTFVPSIAALSTGTAIALATLILVSGLANITAGILVLVNQRARTRWAAITLLSTAGFTVLLGLFSLRIDYFGGALIFTVLLLAMPIGILLGMALGKEKRPAI